MAWKSVEVKQRSQNPKGRVPLSPSAPLMRICACLGFCGTAFLALKAATFMLGLPEKFLEADNWSPREISALGVSFLASTIGGLIGAGMGLQVSIRSASLNRFLAILWHFVASGQLVYSVLLSLALARNQRVATLPETLQAFGLAAAGCVVIAVALFAAGQFRENQPSNPLVWILVAIPITVFIGLQHGRLFSLNGASAIVVGVVAGLGTVFSSAYFIQRDYDQMDRVRSMR